MSEGRAADYVVVGAGSAGCVTATRLVEAGASVILVEAGPDSRNPLLDVPLMTGHFLRGGQYNWNFHTLPVPGFGGRAVDWPRGKAVGGSGAINGMVYARGLALDYDGWAQTGLRDWSWENVAPWFARLEGEAPERVAEAHLRVSRPDWWHPLYDAYLAAAQAAGLGRADDLNAPEAVGAGRYSFTIDRGRRASSARTFLDRVRRNPGLTLIAGGTVLRVPVADGRATGVVLRRRDTEQTLSARREVILCAGTIGSPHLLLLSGVGPAAQLRRHGIAVIADRSQVGRNLHDHVLIRVEHRARQPGPLHRLLRVDRAALAILRALAFGSGPASCFPLLAGGYFRSRPGLEAPDLQSHFLPALSSATVRVNPLARPKGAPLDDGFFANASQMRPASRGWIELASPDPDAAPAIQPNCLDDPRDLDCLVDAVGVLRAVFAQPAFDAWRGEELAPGPAVTDRTALAQWVRRTANTMFHPVGTCRMGVDADSVVDERLRVRGIAGLRVADASVMPTVTSANTAAPAMMIGERAAAFLLEDRT